MSDNITISSGRISARRRKASSPESAKWSTYCPCRTSRRKRWRNRSAMSGSSSTIRMLKLIGSRRLLGHPSNNSTVYHVSRFPMLDLDDPNVRISPSLASYVSIRIGLGDRDGTSCPHPHKLAVLTTRLRQHQTALGDAAVELEQYGAGITIATSQHGDRDRGK